MLDRLTVAEAAGDYWGHYTKEELPGLRASSDIVWGFWNRAAAGKLANLKYIMSFTIVNLDTETLIEQILRNKGLGALPTWPGLVYKVGDELDKTGTVLLGKFAEPTVVR